MPLVKRGGGVSSWDDLTDKPESFAPSAHALDAHTAVTLAELNAKISDADLGPAYTLPTASADTLGGVKVGDRVSISEGVLSADVADWNDLTSKPTDFTPSAHALDAHGSVTLAELNAIISDADLGPAYTLPTASADTLGGVKVGANLSIADGVLSATGGLGGLTEDQVRNLIIALS